MSENKDSGVVGLVGAGAAGAGVGYVVADQSAKGFVGKVLQARGAAEGSDAAKAIKDVKADVVKTIQEKAGSTGHDAFKVSTQTSGFPANMPNGLTGEKVQEGAKALGAVGKDGHVISAVEGVRVPGQNQGFILKITHGKGTEKIVSHIHVDKMPGEKIGLKGLKPEHLTPEYLEGQIKRIGGIEVKNVSVLNEVLPKGAPSYATLHGHAVALKDVKPENVQGVTIKQVSVPGKDGAKATEHFIAEVEHITKPAVKEGDVVTEAAQVTKRTVLLQGLPEGVKIPEGQSHVVLEAAERGKFVENGLGKAAQQTESAALKGVRGGLEKGFAMKNMGAGRIALAGAAAVGTAFVAKVAFDSLFGGRKESGYAAQIDAQRAAAAGAEPARA